MSITFGEFALDLGTRSLTKAGEPVPLTTGEFAVLKVFARFPRVPRSREKLMELARGRDVGHGLVRPRCGRSRALLFPRGADAVEKKTPARFHN